MMGKSVKTKVWLTYPREKTMVGLVDQSGAPRVTTVVI